MATSEGIPSSIDIEFLELNDNPYNNKKAAYLLSSKIITNFAVGIIVYKRSKDTTRTTANEH